MVWKIFCLVMMVLVRQMNFLRLWTGIWLALSVMSSSAFADIDKTEAEIPLCTDASLRQSAFLHIQEARRGNREWDNFLAAVEDLRRCKDLNKFKDFEHKTGH